MSEQPRKIAVLVENEYIPEEIRAYQEVFSQSGYEVQLVSRLWGQERAKYISALDPLEYKPGYQHEQLEVTVDFDKVSVEDYAAVLIAANYVSVRLRYFDREKDENDPRKSHAVVFFARAMRNESVVKGALCHGLWILTPVPELLAGRKVICHEVVQADIENAGGIITQTPDKVVVDGDLVTGYSKNEARALAEAVIGQIARQREVKAVQATSSEKQADSGPSLGGNKPKRILTVLSEWGYWGEELIGPLDQFDAAGYHVDFCTATGRRPNAIPASMELDFIDPALKRPVTTEEVARKVREIDNPATPQGQRLEHRLNLSEWIPAHPYASSPTYVRALEAYNRNLDRALERIAPYDAILLVGGSGPLVDMANNGRLHDLILGFLRAGKIVAAECYGVACLAFARSWEDRKSIIWGRRVTGHCLEYDYQDGTGFVKARNTPLDFNMGPPPYPLEFILRDATGPEGAYIGNFGKERSVIVDYPFVTGRSTPDSYLTGQKLIEMLETGLRRWGW
jgi:putative intracellular protease/amidase